VRTQALVALAGALLAAAAALAWDLSSQPVYAARATLLVGGAVTKQGSPLRTQLETLAQLARTQIVAQNVVQALGSHQTAASFLRGTSADAESRTALLRLTVREHSQVDAVRACQQYTLTFMALARAHLSGAAAGLSVWQPPQPLGRVAPHTSRDVSVAALVGFLAGLGATLARRRPPRGQETLTVGDLKLNPDTHEVARADREIDLTQREFELLEYLMRNERIVISRQRLLDEVWGYDPFSMTNTIEVFVSNLRRKLEAGGEPRLLHTIRGAGYVLRV